MPATLIASSIFTMQNGHAVTITLAPASAAIWTRFTPIRSFFFRLVELRQSASTAAERAVSRTAHLDPLQTGNSIQHISRVVINLVVPPQVAGIVVGVDVVAVFHCMKLDFAGLHFAREHLANVLDRRHIFVVMLQSVVGVRIGSNDPLYPGRLNGIHVVFPQGHEQRLLAEAADFMPAVFFRGAQDSEILADVIEDFGCGAPNGLDPVIVGSDAVDEIQSVGLVLPIQGLHLAGWPKFFGVGPVGSFLFHLAVRISATLQCFERFLQGLRHIPVVDHAPAQIDHLVDILDQQRAFFLASAAGGAGPDFILGINAANQRLVPLFDLPNIE